MKTYLKLLGIYSDDLLTEVMAEVHKDNLNQVRDYIEEYEKGVSKNESDNITWIIKKQFYPSLPLANKKWSLFGSIFFNKYAFFSVDMRLLDF